MLAVNSQIYKFVEVPFTLKETTRKKYTYRKLLYLKHRKPITEMNPS